MEQNQMVALAQNYISAVIKLWQKQIIFIIKKISF